MVVSILGHPKVSSFLRKTRIWRKYPRFQTLFEELPKFFPPEDWVIWLRECQKWEKEKNSHWKLLTYDDELYPSSLLEIFDPPLVLVCMGDVTLLQRELVAIVGTRKASPISLTATKALVRSLSEWKQISIVSGMALGIDRQAFVSALEMGIPVVGVLGTTLGTEYPLGNRDLYKRMKLDPKQLLLSEFLMYTEPARWTFPKRNRVISGLSQKVFIMESGKKSGTISTAKSAMEQNRDIFVFDHPKQFDNEGGKMLLRQGAEPVRVQFAESEEKVNQVDPKVVSYEEWFREKNTSYMRKREEVSDFQIIL